MNKRIIINNWTDLSEQFDGTNDCLTARELATGIEKKIQKEGILHGHVDVDCNPKHSEAICIFQLTNVVVKNNTEISYFDYLGTAN